MGPIEDPVIARINPTVGVVEPIYATSCFLHTGADAMETIAIYLSMLMLDFRVDGPPELVAHIRTLATRYAAAAGAGRDPATTAPQRETQAPPPKLVS